MKADAETIKRHERFIDSALRSRSAAEEALRLSIRDLAYEVRIAKKAGVPHQHIATRMGLTRDGLTKFLRRNQESE